ncbi:MAG: NAD+ synthase [Candidatus Eisenbacteria bacterium]|uniref:Glutamine-dependent NAD(+) synthetase n=1 Tax=Eiseniibacteriota bacterium TaxID=2212470 RepID=A0A538SEJ6_UNCEI|nr:MAG: NAD+ synthase [Candidatus Eisenbacteria bacterium]
MRQLRLGLAQLNPTVGDVDGNVARVAAYLEQARGLGVDLLAFPEMVITGYPPEDLLLKPSFIEYAIERTRDLLPRTLGMTVVVGTVDRDFDLYNAAAVLHDGRWMGTYRKRYLPNYGVFDENRYFMPGTRNPVFVRGGTIIGINICEDIWYPGGPVEEQVIRGGAEIVINISASPYHAGKAQVRKRMLCTRAADNLAVVCYVNLVGGQDEVIYDGCSLIVDEQGQVLAEGKMFEEDLVVADVELDSVFSARLHDPRLRKGRALEAGEGAPRIDLPALGTGATPAPDPAGGVAPLPRGGGNGGVATAVAAKPALERRAAPTYPELVPEVYGALVLGTLDYVRKNGFETVVLGLSGGVDSALCACIAADALGPANVVGVSMPSGFTSTASREDAESLARNLGIRHTCIPIRDVFEAYLKVLEPAFDGKPPDITEENLQARIRGNYLMALSNKFGWLVLTTGNKSEVSAGYSTLYGDMAGGFAVLKDVYKTMVYQLARHRNQCGERPVVPERTLTRAPSAELKPDQTDQDTLPPYEVLDPILRLYVEEDRSAREIADLGYDEAVVRRVVTMVDRAEYKRRQSPPGIKITPRAFGKDRRLPITNRWAG